MKAHLFFLSLKPLTYLITLTLKSFLGGVFGGTPPRKRGDEYFLISSGDPRGGRQGIFSTKADGTKWGAKGVGPMANAHPSGSKALAPGLVG